MNTFRSLRVLMAASFIAVAGSVGTVWAQTPTGAPPVGQTPAPPAVQPGRGVPTPVVIGPPAPVPPEVAMLRPTAGELTQINDEVKKLIDSDESAAKPLLKKYESILMLQPPRLNVAATFTQT